MHLTDAITLSPYCLIRGMRNQTNNDYCFGYPSFIIHLTTMQSVAVINMRRPMIPRCTQMGITHGCTQGGCDVPNIITKGWQPST